MSSAAVVIGGALWVKYACYIGKSLYTGQMGICVCCKKSIPYFSKFKSHSLRKSDTFQYGLEIEKIDFSETLPIFNLYRVMNTNVKNLAICLTVSMATTIF